MPLTRKILVRNDLDELSRAAAELFIEIGTNCIKARGRFSVALSGGSTPMSLYRSLADSDVSKNLEWKKAIFFFGDERRVSSDSSESNFRMARETLLDPLRIDPANIYAWPTGEERAEDAAKKYSLELAKLFEVPPRFDLVLLGLGSDAHTASLFPHSPALHEREKFAVENWIDKLNDYRFTLTFPVINNAAHVIFLVSGEDKATAVADVLEGDFRPDDFPAQFVLPQNGQLFWLLDEAATLSLRNPESLHLRRTET